MEGGIGAGAAAVSWRTWIRVGWGVGNIWSRGLPGGKLGNGRVASRYRGCLRVDRHGWIHSRSRSGWSNRRWRKRFWGWIKFSGLQCPGVRERSNWVRDVAAARRALWFNGTPPSSPPLAL